ncbi:MAG: Methyltransferase type 11 [Candidatus Woesebacteria bacterium GW2011_GWB1_43_14]|uniref:Methyltransferase type 11 n=1 Tax=Candidatus Woesebacteria bacterium GW2011_GWB1_43_14 TaxID=1618578 RepID=A0A0G1DHP1_9BACT|nr:MAG: Methyltransferase type 11 [Candidatus Woesebacteria bacterium GW2011_GWA1_39_11b]KKS78379.1 MAG: Methyltransferase type 11 [Candidatus Woesebacteria bacterium GW2011_GWC1_42_9]KKS97204.1 MAG: Methyltransferase type 11 [Candidatus Woesebacteria bacterium GW2011_GWB1_43_14]
MITEQNYYKHRTKESVSERVLGAVVQEALKLAEENTSKKISQLVVLDVGSGSGEYSFVLERYVKKVVGVEPYLPKHREAIKGKKKRRSSVVFVNKKIEDFSSKQKFDLVLSITTIEHMPESEKSFRKIFNLMNKGGLLYLTSPNKSWPIEAHYHLPFLSWLPLKWANKYMQLTRKGETYEDCSYSLTYRGTKKFFDQFPCKYRFIVPENADVGYLGCGEGDGFYRLGLKIGIRLIKISPFFWNFSKGFVLIAIKK